MVTASSIKIREIGSSPPAGFQLSGAMIGSTASANSANTICNLGCRRGPSARGLTSEYA